jgi:hypothetical protein
MTEQEIKHTYTMAILFGMWLKEPGQRKRLSKVDVVDLFDEWIKLIAKDLDKDE